MTDPPRIFSKYTWCGDYIFGNPNLNVKFYENMTGEVKIIGWNNYSLMPAVSFYDFSFMIMGKYISIKIPEIFAISTKFEIVESCEWADVGGEKYRVDYFIKFEAAVFPLDLEDPDEIDNRSFEHSIDQNLFNLPLEGF